MGGNKDVPTDLHGIFLQSLFFRATEKLSGASLGTMFGGLNFLLVLDLDKIEYLPSEVGDLVHLRYLGVEDSSISELPSSIGNLKNLQTLDIRQCDIEKLPDEILSMEKLRHIEMSSSIGDCEIRVPSGIGTLVHLHSLCEVYAGDGIAQELGSLTQLRELGVKRVSDDHAGELLESIMKMDDLVSLSLEAETTWIDGEAEDSMKTTLLPSLEGFSPPPLLRKLHLHGRLVELPEWIALMGNLTRLNLSFSYLSESPTPVLQFLPRLKHLGLWHAFYVNYIGKEFCPPGGFQQLETFSLSCDSLVGWTEIEDGALPRLKYLSFHCKKLKLLPEGLQNLSKLQMLGIYPLHHDLLRRLKGKEKYKIEHIATVMCVHP